ncbi:hypothetical protein PXH69_29205 [Rhodococcus qingshengii]|uniref:Uncharacterized protein n=1 Tax=Rhodococcus qingshengii TaxID=334542 RepID=A0AAW6LVB3_RHOSG|nr:hypothetical protein [Rhodococcus qingshengii]MDE8649057.1 hypothetical protein [Rhodococcus qingshengii]
MSQARWIDTLIDEKGYDPEHIFEVEGPSGINTIPLGVVIESFKSASSDEQLAIKKNLIALDFRAADLLEYFGKLAEALAR